MTARRPTPAPVPAARQQQSPGNPHALTGAAPHQCTSCGARCRPCAEAAAAGHPLPHTIRAAWCRWCAEVYAENSPAEDGRVWCQNPECEYDAPFPTLAVLIERGVPRYPAYCRACRGNGRRAARLEREAQADPRSAPAGARPRRTPRPLVTTPVAQKDVDERERNWARGGFRPRPPGPETVESEYSDGETAWPGASAHPL